ncbi:MAG: hypothetical protein PHX61_14550 [Alphaproteobacteria bacterium]|nr:hypothetical protein [Alphaproteobacteria bacterium]
MGFLDDLKKNAEKLGDKVTRDAERAARHGVEGVLKEAVKPAEKKVKEVGGKAAEKVQGAGAAARGHVERAAQDPAKAVKDGVGKAGEAVGAGVDAVKGGAGKVWNFLKENHEKHKDDPPSKPDYLGASEGASSGKPASLFADNMQEMQSPATSAQGASVQVAASAKLDVPTVG